jgi:hypothetical protein
MRVISALDVLHCAPELVAWGDWRQPAVMAFAYRDPRFGERVAEGGGDR